LTQPNYSFLKERRQKNGREKETDGVDDCCFSNHQKQKEERVTLLSHQEAPVNLLRIAHSHSSRATMHRRGEKKKRPKTQKEAESTTTTQKEHPPPPPPPPQQKHHTTPPPPPPHHKQ